MFNSKIAIASILISLGASQARASDDVVIETFDQLHLGTTDFSVASPFNFKTNVSGGSVVSGVGHSGTQFYEGKSIGLVTEDEHEFSWPGIGAWVSGADSITLRAYEYNIATETEDEITPVSIWTGGEFAYLSIGSFEDPRVITKVVFSSTSEFKLDDLTLGIEGIGPGIPEPASWAMLVGGMGVVGIAMRRRDRKLRRAA